MQHPHDFKSDLPPELRQALADARAILEQTGDVPMWHEQAVLGALGPPCDRMVPHPKTVEGIVVPFIEIQRTAPHGLPPPISLAERTVGHCRRILLAWRVFYHVQHAGGGPGYQEHWPGALERLRHATAGEVPVGCWTFNWIDEDYSDPGIVQIVGGMLQSVIEYDGDLCLYPLPAAFIADRYLSVRRTTTNSAVCVGSPPSSPMRTAFWRWWLDAAVPAAYQAIPDLDRVPTTGRMVSLADLPLEDVLILPEPAPPPPPDPALRFPADLPYDLRRAMAAADTVLRTVGDVPTWHAQAVLGALGAPGARLVPQTAHVPYHNLTIAYRACPPSAFIPLAERTPGHRRRIDLAWRVFQYMQGDRVLSGAVLRDRELLQRATAGDLPVGQRTFARAARHDPTAQILKIVGQALQDAIERDGDLFLYPLPAEFLNNLILSPWITTVSWSLELRPPLGDPAQVAFWRWWLDEAVPAAYRAIPDMGHDRGTALTI